MMVVVVEAQGEMEEQKEKDEKSDQPSIHRDTFFTRKRTRFNSGGFLILITKSKK